MGETRGKKGKKSGWQITLGPKELIFAAMGLAGLVMLSFALGTLAGRGDIYRVLHNWGLLGPEAGKVIQVFPAASSPPAPSAGVPSGSLPQEASVAAPASGSQVVAAKTPAPAPMEGPGASPPSPAPATKKSSQVKGKAKEDRLEKLRQEVAPRLKFQNSLDPGAKKPGRHPEQAKKEPDKTEKTGRIRGTPAQIFVAKYRDGQQAKNQLAKMRKQGEKVNLKEGTDSEGRYYALYREVTGAGSPSPPQTSEKKTKPTTGQKSGKPTP